MNIDQGANRPKLKKIKRPINRTMPIDSQAPHINNQAQHSQISQPRQEARVYDNRQQQNQYVTTEELDRYLDNTSNLPDMVHPAQNHQPNYISEEEYYGNQDAYQDVPSWLNVKVFALALAVSLVFGLLLGKFIFSQSTVVRNGLQGVVVNAEVPRGRARCGVAERSQGCVLYVMNPQKQEMVAKDFYDLASQMTGRQRFMIETGNMRYANTRIRPGDIAQLNIPPL